MLDTSINSFFQCQEIFSSAHLLDKAVDHELHGAGFAMEGALLSALRNGKLRLLGVVSLEKVGPNGLRISCPNGIAEGIYGM